MNCADLQALDAKPAEPAATAAVFGFGAAMIDRRLGGGLAMAALHELYAGGEADAATAAAMAVLLAMRTGREGPIVWLGDDASRRAGRLYGLGLAELGVDPTRLLLVEAPDAVQLLRASAEATACGGVAAVIVVVAGKAAALDLTATRRLGLSAARSGVTILLVRDGAPAPSAASTRWQVGSAASTAMPGQAPASPAFALSLLRHRGGIAGFSCILEWDRDRKAFGAARSGAVPAAAFQRAGSAPARRAA